ncbi:glycosyltransferase family 2 protein [Arthrobacter sp. KK5.5]|uniref:glycosyltransferase family 2 protein n=1 Tax=Arthrobacter sp. KK5.5 TaxID=3373084 RepID=UPI003EE6F3EE
MDRDVAAPDVSLLVIVRGRAEHLRRLVDGTNRAEPKPREIVVVHMGEPETEGLESDIAVRRFRLEVPDGGTLPLAAARNLAAREATGGFLVFLDVDCIPARGMFGELMRDAESVGGIAMATPRYLRGPLAPDEPVDDALLHGASVPHHTRAALGTAGAAQASTRYEMFWTLGFAVAAGDFRRIGGFDESFAGYGAEDTDFAFTARRLGVPLAFSRATIYHQHHGSHWPPLNHFADIVANAGAFRDKWGTWPMEGWLDAFAQLGLVEWTPSATSIRALRRPTDDEVAAAAHEGAY